MLTPHAELWRVFASWHFALYEVFNIVLNDTFNILFVWLARRHQRPPFDFVDTSLIWTICLYTLVMSLFMFAFSFDVHKRIREHKGKPVLRSALCDSRVKRILFWGMSETSWKKRLPKFVTCCIVTCAIPITVFFWLLCYVTTGFPDNKSCSASSLWQLVGYDAWWKSMVTAVIVAVNYAACHNDEAPEVQPRTDDAMETVTVANINCENEDALKMKHTSPLADESTSLLCRDATVAVHSAPPAKLSICDREESAAEEHPERGNDSSLTPESLPISPVAVVVAAEVDVSSTRQSHSAQGEPNCDVPQLDQCHSQGDGVDSEQNTDAAEPAVAVDVADSNEDNV